MENNHDSHDIPPELLRAIYESDEDDDLPDAIQQFADLDAGAFEQYLSELSDEELDHVASTLQRAADMIKQRIREVAQGN